MSLIHLYYGVSHYPHILGKFIYNYGFSWFAPTITITRKKDDIELITPEDKRVHKNEYETALIPYVPITIKMPTMYDISAKIITTAVIDIPIYVLKSLYSSPIPTTVALYAILPPEVWMIVGPRILYYLPKMI